MNLGDIPLKKLKPEMFHRGPHFKTWKEKVQESKLENNGDNNNFMMQKYFTGRWNDIDNFANNRYWQSTSEYQFLLVVTLVV